MTEPIKNNFNPASIGNTNLGHVKHETTAEQKQEKQEFTQVKAKNVPEAEVWGYMGGLAAQNNVKLSPSALVSKYNTPEQVANITAAMLDEFVPGVVAALPKFEKELGVAFTNLSDADKLAVGAEAFASETVE